MTTTEEIIVSGEGFIERRIFISPQPEEIEDLQDSAFRNGYSRGWMRGFLIAVGLCAAVALLVWWAIH